MSKRSDRYDKPKLRERLKQKIQREDRGGRPGQWSARKAQLLKHDYEKAGGGYTQPPSGEQKSLKRWTKEGWTTQDGSKSLGGGRAKRYLPKAAWSKLSPAERKQAEASKAEGDAEGKQFVENPKGARKARQDATAGGGKKKAGKKKAGKKKAGKKKAGKKKVSKKKAGKKKVSKKKAGKKKVSKKKAGKKKVGKKKAGKKKAGKKKASRRGPSRKATSSKRTGKKAGGRAGKKPARSRRRGGG